MYRAKAVSLCSRVRPSLVMLASFSKGPKHISKSWAGINKIRKLKYSRSAKRNIQELICWVTESHNPACYRYHLTTSLKISPRGWEIFLYNGHMSKRLSPEQWWYGLLTGENPALPVRHFRHFLKMLPTGPRCKFCNAPYHGIGAPIMRSMAATIARSSPVTKVQALPSRSDRPVRPSRCV